jgi:hypothetical protein
VIICSSLNRFRFILAPCGSRHFIGQDSLCKLSSFRGQGQDSCTFFSWVRLVKTLFYREPSRWERANSSSSESLPAAGRARWSTAPSALLRGRSRCLGPKPFSLCQTTVPILPAPPCRVQHNYRFSIAECSTSCTEPSRTEPSAALTARSRVRRDAAVVCGKRHIGRTPDRASVARRTPAANAPNVCRRRNPSAPACPGSFIGVAVVSGVARAIPAHPRRAPLHRRGLRGGLASVHRAWRTRRDEWHRFSIPCTSLMAVHHLTINHQLHTTDRQLRT